MPARTPWRRRTAIAVAAATIASVAAVGGTALPAAASSLGSQACLPPNGLSGLGQAAADNLYNNGSLAIPGFRNVSIGTSGHVNWAMNPYDSQVWQKYFYSLKWVELLTLWYQRNPSRNAGYLHRAELYAQDFANTYGAGRGPVTAWNPMYTGQRATVYSCLTYLRSTNTGAFNALRVTGGWLAGPHDPGDWNQGVDYNLGLLAAGCVLGQSTWRDHAASRLTSMSTTTIDSQGAIAEQAPGYGDYLYRKLGIARDMLNACTGTAPSTIDSRRALLIDYLAWDTTPGGDLTQLGDTQDVPPPGTSTAPGTSSEWAATQGASGTHPSALVALYTQGGYAFGRSTWDPFASANYYSLRYGPGTVFHGHADHEQLTMYAFGHDVLVEGGYDGYATGAYHDWLRAPEAHNVLVEPGVAFNQTLATTLARANTKQDAWQYYEVKDTAYAGRGRVRDVYVSQDLPFSLVFDHASRASSGVFQQLWHLPIGTTIVSSGRSSATARSADGRLTTYFFQLPIGGSIPAGATGVVSGQTSPYQGWVSLGNGQRAKAPVVVMGRRGTSASIFTVVVPAATGTGVHVSMGKIGTAYTTITVTVGSTSRTVVLNTSNSMWLGS